MKIDDSAIVVAKNELIAVKRQVEQAEAAQVTAYNEARSLRDYKAGFESALRTLDLL